MFTLFVIRFFIYSKYNPEEPCVYHMHIICIQNKTGAQGNYFSDPLFQHQDRLFLRRKNFQKPNIETPSFHPKDQFWKRLMQAILVNIPLVTLKNAKHKHIIRFHYDFVSTVVTDPKSIDLESMSVRQLSGQIIQCLTVTWKINNLVKTDWKYLYLLQRHILIVNCKDRLP